MPNVDGTSKPPTLISTLKRTLAERLGCNARDSVTLMYALLFWNMGKLSLEENTERIVNGEALIQSQTCTCSSANVKEEEEKCWP